MDLALIAAEWESGLIPPERLPAIAVRLMEAGYDSPSLRLTAGLLPLEVEDAHDLFKQALGELGDPRIRDERERGLALIQEYGKRVAAGTVSPYDGARTIWQIAIDSFDNESWLAAGSPDGLVILADEWEQLPDQRDEIERDMRDAIEVLLKAIAALP